jgi:inosose dehydratase
MTIQIGNAPCSWGVEFADDPRNPAWQKVLSDCAAAGYKGIELGPIGFPTAGRADAAEQMDHAEWAAFRDRIATVARMGTEDYGLTVGIHAHAAGFIDFEPELERLLSEVDETHLKICFDTGHHSYAGFDPVAFMRRHIDRISYMHFKDIDPVVKADAIAKSTGFYDACGQGIFCNLGKGDVDFPAVRQILLDAGFEGWCTVEQDCDPTLDVSPVDDARANRDYLHSIGFN